jgi:hypothetical protein
MFSSVPCLTPEEFYLCAHLKERICSLRPSNIEDLLGKTSSSSDDKRCRHVKLCLKECLEVTEIASNTCCNYESHLMVAFDVGR